MRKTSDADKPLLIETVRLTMSLFAYLGWLQNHMIKTPTGRQVGWYSYQIHIERCNLVYYLTTSFYFRSPVNALLQCPQATVFCGIFFFITCLARRHVWLGKPFTQYSIRPFGKTNKSLTFSIGSLSLFCLVTEFVSKRLKTMRQQSRLCTHSRTPGSQLASLSKWQASTYRSAQRVTLLNGFSPISLLWPFIFISFFFSRKRFHQAMRFH